jgi:transposase
LAPPENAIVLCVDEKSQIQALDRTAPTLPMQPGRAASWSHDYRRHGTTTLFAVLEIATGTVTAACKPRHRHQELHAHFTPTSASWLNLVEAWFGIIERQALRRGVSRSVRELNAKIRAFINGWNHRCHPFVWTKTAEEILAKANRRTTSVTHH